MDQTNAQEVLISADSHVLELPDLWEKPLAKTFGERAPRVYYDEKRESWMFGSAAVLPQAVGGLFMAGHKPEELAEVRKAGFAAARQGGWDPVKRIQDMEIDGVSAEVLYPSMGLGLFCIEDAALQEACFRVYNDWLIDYCRGAPDRLVGIALISVYEIDHAVRELERCKKQGLCGAMIWQVPHPRLPFTADHYERFWAAAEDLDMPVHLHILTGFGASMHRQTLPGIERCRRGVNQTEEISNALFDMIFSGVLERFPRLNVVSVENEIGWMPFWIGQCDKAFARHRSAVALPIHRRPSEYFERQVYATFFNDDVGGRLLAWWGAERCMWSNDYPHQNSTWPHSRDVIARDLGHLPADKREKLVRGNVARLYRLTLPAAA
ncbi:MAG TPA: amidohydrolase family protein [Candidatus Acidoferrales bacterium]|nr:amidohydrolase family protein [Candidatus Acidoferrales bacterium]